ncbi:MAG: nucleoside-diphosphate-sugar epimerase [Bacteroidia bacterium]|jgi:nucleoside-diphosphate-sugar epimerase
MASKTGVLVIGASGQLGTELVMALREQYGNQNVLAADLKTASNEVKESGPFELLDVMDRDRLHQLVVQYNIGQVYLLAALLSAMAEQKVMPAWNLNIYGLFYVLELAKEGLIDKVYWPSSIAVFGPNTLKLNTPQSTITEPSTVYGISKLAGERWCDYYNKRYGVDVRSLRYPGLIGNKGNPGGGTTDYAVDIFHKAVSGLPYECFLSKNTRLPMMYMPDAIRATINLMEAPEEQIKIRSGYNLSAFSFTPEELAMEIRKHIPDFSITYNPDFRQEIADGWPSSVDDSIAALDWGWKHEFTLETMTSDMLHHLSEMAK